MSLEFRVKYRGNIYTDAILRSNGNVIFTLMNGEEMNTSDNRCEVQFVTGMNKKSKSTLEKFKNNLRSKKYDLPQPSKSVAEFYEWCVKNNDVLLKKGHDVLGCVKEWENYLINKK